MISPINRLCKAMELYFLAQETITAKIANRLTRGPSQSRIAAQENPESTVASTQGLFAEYDWAGHARGLVLGRKGGLPVARFDYRFFARYIADATMLYDAFYGVFRDANDAVTDRFSGLWGAGTEFEMDVKGARWDDESANDDREQTMGLAVLNVSLIVPFLIPSEE